MATHQEQNKSILDQFSRQAASYARLTSGAKNTTAQLLLDAVKPSKTDRVLDVGCGPGRLTLALAEATAEVTGIDLTPAMLDHARAKQAELGLSNVHWLQGDILPLPFPDGAFTLVVTQATFHHFAEPAAVLAQMARVCAPGGHVAVIDLALDPDKGRAFDQVERMRDPSHMRVVAVEDLHEMGRKLGLEEIFVHKFGGPMPFEAVLATSFPPPGNLERVRALFEEDAASGRDVYGLHSRMENGQVVVTYTNAMTIWRRP